MSLKSLLIPIFFLFSMDSFCQASASANFTASVTIIEPIGISTTSNMNFARIDAKSGGMVTLNPDNTRVTSGGVVAEPGGEISAATFLVTGQSGFAFSVALPRGQHELTNGNHKIILRDFTSHFEGEALAGEGKILRVGASLEIAPNQEPGEYFSAGDLQVTVNYN